MYEHFFFSFVAVFLLFLSLASFHPSCSSAIPLQILTAFFLLNGVWELDQVCPGTWVIFYNSVC